MPVRLIPVENPEAGNPPGLVHPDWFENYGKERGWVRADTADQLNKKKDAELRALADLVGVAVPAGAKKSELVKLLAGTGDMTAPTGQEA